MPIVVGTGTPNDMAWTWTDGKNYRADYEHDALSQNLKPQSGTEWTKGPPMQARRSASVMGAWSMSSL
jgi:hypothetical protein